MARRLQRPSLLTSFGVTSAIVVIALGLVVGFLLREVIVDRTVSDARRTAIAVAEVGVHAHLTPADLLRDFVPLEPERVAALDQAMAASTSEDGFARIKIWNAQNWIVYSDNEALRGRWFPGEDQLDGALAGEVTDEVTDLSSPEEFEEARQFEELLAVYVPLRSEGERFASLDEFDVPVIGASEVYLPWEPIAADIRRDTGRLVAVLTSGLLVLYAALYRLVARASARLRQQAADNDHLARHDQLTGLPNRLSFEERAEQLVPAGAALLLLDLDRFQIVNDTLGHDVGDEILREVGRRLLDRYPTEQVARLGGDEFAVLLPSGDLAEAQLGAQVVLDALEAPFVVGELTLDVEGSIGLACAPTHGETTTSLLQHADLAMYEAKRTRHRVVVYDPANDRTSPEQLALAGEIPAALKRGELVAHYQPQLDLRTGRIVAVEALIRWEHPERGRLSPGLFLPVVETTDLVHPVTRHVIDQALADVARWRAAGQPLQVAVNVAAHGLLDPRLVDHVAERLIANDLPGSALRVELTESALLTDPERAKVALEQLRALGCGVSIDDFGTGYASLAYLRDFPVDELKLDRSLVVTALGDQHERALLEASMQLGRRLGLTLVAEGIEDEATLRWLRDAGCDLAQGFLMARPMPASDLDSWLPSAAFRMRPLLGPQHRRLVRAGADGDGAPTDPDGGPDLGSTR
ncbi:MAG: bifunctional diguanylate cyclase/phosphodiesterase [Nitriliruptoraceae bacterium]|nr:bifunctional diguanylate cyclase/phosphodiesterase [Nitriliruptoraceae bacterium]